jgi:hydroxypyruvate reductase
MTPPILLMHALSPTVRPKLAERYTLIGPSSNPLGALAESGVADKVRVAITIGGIGVRPEIMEALPALELICAFGAGYDGVDFAAMKARGIRLTSARGANASCVADMAMTLLLAAVLRLREAENCVRDGKWDRVPPRGWSGHAGFGGRKLGIQPDTAQGRGLRLP